LGVRKYQKVENPWFKPLYLITLLPGHYKTY
jgi:hypothetical protein